jgi:hypothetical protein
MAKNCEKKLLMRYFRALNVSIGMINCYYHEMNQTHEGRAYG